jgi:kynurenine formamidase
MTRDRRVQFDFDITFSNGGGLTGRAFRLDIDDTTDGTRPVHTTLLGAGIPIVEHLTRLDALPVTGARFFAVPPKVRGLGTFPVRAFAKLAS